MKQVAIVLLIMFSASLAFGAGKKVDYSVDGITYEGYFTGPEGEGAPLLLLIHDWDGLTEYEIKRAEMLKEKGYAVFAADLFGKGVRPTEVKDKRQHTGELYKDRAKNAQGFRGLFLIKGYDWEETVKTQPHLVIVLAVLLYWRWPDQGADLKSFITFHGGLATPEGQGHSETKGEVIVFHGTADTAITMEEFAGLAVELEEAKVTHEMITYSGAPHAFTVFGSSRYREDADRKSWQRFVQYLEQTMK